MHSASGSIVAKNFDKRPTVCTYNWSRNRVRGDVSATMHESGAISWCGMSEPFSAVSHWLGASVFTGVFLHVMTCVGLGRRHAVGLAILGITTVQTLVMSGMFHLFPPGPCRDFCLRADVAGIFFLIAGSMTSIHVILFDGWWRWLPTVLAWCVAATGATLKLTVLPGPPGVAGTLIFLIFGWGGVVTTIKLWREYGWRFIRLPVLSGLVYTVGALLLIMDQPKLVPGVIGPHEVWHLAVLGALGLHWRFIYRIATLTVPLRAAVPPNAHPVTCQRQHHVGVSARGGG